MMFFNFPIAILMTGLACSLAGTTVLAQTVTASPATAGPWGTYLKPFAANSLWNSRPVNPVLDDYEIPKSSYFPGIAEGTWSTGVFLARPSDPSVTVKGLPGKPGLWNPDSEIFQDVTLPHWPADLIPASGADGHAEIVDPDSGKVHSFYQLRQVNGQWIAGLYAWSPLNGRGWADPAHYYHGARATGVPSSAGLIRKHEFKDGDVMYRHALALSLTYNAMSAKPTYIFPATSADWDAAKTNTGKIPEGALLMLPASFNTQQINNPKLRKIAETLKVYGGYVVDRNVGTPFVVYVENGTGFDLHKGGWDNAAASDLERIRLGLRQVVSAGEWMDGDGKPFVPEKNLNLLSMRGPWRLQAGTVAGVFDSWTQALVFPAATAPIIQVNDSMRGMNSIAWATPETGRRYRLTAHATGGAKLRIQIRDKGMAIVVFDSGALEDGMSASFTWPLRGVLVAIATSGVGQASSVWGELIAAQ